MIEFEAATKYYGSKPALDEVSFEAMAGEVTALIGPNGAGKTTLFRCLLGLDRLDAGEALIDGTPYAQLKQPVQNVGVLLDSRHGNPGRTGYQHLRVKAIQTGLSKAHVWNALEEVGLANSGHKRIGAYSLGMKQRLGIAYALLCQPQTVILDEPLNGLDSDGIRWVRGLTRKLADAGRTVLLSSHFMSEVESTADRVVILNRGRVVSDSDANNLTKLLGTIAASEDREGLLAALTRGSIEFEVREGTVFCGQTSAQEIGRLALENGIALSRLEPLTETLEAAYLRIIAQADLDYVGEQSGD